MPIRTIRILLVAILLFSDAAAQDALEENDSCSTAVPLPLGETPLLSVRRDDEDWYERTLTPGQSIEVTTSTSSGNWTNALTLSVQETCGTVIERVNRMDFGRDRILIGNPSNQPRSVTFGVALEGSLQEVPSYLLRANLVPPPPCFGGPGDAFEPNDTCASPSTLAIGQTLSGVSENGNDDWYAIVVPPGDQLDIVLRSPDAVNDMDLELYGQDCGHFIERAQNSFSDASGVGARNTSALPQTFHVRVAIRVESGVCYPYTIEAIGSPGTGFCFPETPDALEPDNSIATATQIAATPAQFTGLSLTRSNHDLYRVTVGVGELLRASLQYFLTTNWNVEVMIWADDAPPGSQAVSLGTSTSMAGDAEALWRNLGSSPRDVFVRVNIREGSPFDCNGDGSYDLQIALETDLCSQPNDAFAPNQFCNATALLTSFPFQATDLIAKPAEPDFFSVDLAPGEALNLVMLYDREAGFMNVAEFEGCTMLAVQSTDTGVRQFTRRNDSNQMQRWSYRIGAAEPCQSYELFVDRYFGAPINPAALCFGNGPQAACPCSNNSPAGSIAGCLHPGGVGARLSSAGGPSLQNGFLNLQLRSASPDSFGLLVSGQNLLPASSPGTGIPTAGSGLRCVGGDFQRHGIRMTDSSGDGTAVWGPGLLSSAGMTPGMTRTFQVFYREPAVAGCASGINTTQALRVTALP